MRDIPLNGTIVDLPGDVRVSARDTNGMLSLTNINISALGRLVDLLGDGKANSEVFKNSLLDWTDADTLVRVNGAEEQEYRMLGKPYGPRNYPVQYAQEVSLVNGMDDELSKKILPHLTILTVTGFNPNTASVEVLRAYLDIDKETADTVEAYIAAKPVLSDLELFSLTGRRIFNDESVNFFPSGLLELTIQAGKPRTEYTIRAGIDLRQNSTLPFAVVYWKEG
jgi:general secretion pathway protein K